MSDPRYRAIRRTLSLVAGLALAAAFAVMAVRCTSPARRDAGPAPSAEATHGHEPPSGAPAIPSASAPEAKLEARASSPDAGAPTGVGRLMRATDAHDRDLLARIERETHAAPPAPVRQLLELRRAGRPRAELEQFIHEELGGGVPVRRAAMRWLRAIYGDPEPVRDIEVVREPGAPEPGPRNVKPLTKKP